MAEDKLGEYKYFMKKPGKPELVDITRQMHRVQANNFDHVIFLDNLYELSLKQEEQIKQLQADLALERKSYELTQGLLTQAESREISHEDRLAELDAALVVAGRKLEDQESMIDRVRALMAEASDQGSNQSTKISLAVARALDKVHDSATHGFLKRVKGCTCQGCAEL